MAFLSKVGNILRQTASRQSGAEFSAFRPSIYQAIRCMSTSKLFVGGISYATDETSLQEAFGKYGEVIEARIIMDRETGRSRGFGFITYTSVEEASSAIQALDGQDLHGRRIRVNYATDRARGGFGGGGGGFGGGGRYGGTGYGDGGYGGGGYNSNYGSPAGNYGGGPGGNYGYGGDNVSSGGGSYGSGGNYGAGGNFGGGGYGSGGNVGSNFGGDYAGGSTGAFGSGATDFGVAGGTGGNDNFNSSGMAGGYEGSTELDNDSFADKESSGLDDTAGNDPLEANYRDEDDNDSDFAKRA